MLTEKQLEKYADVLLWGLKTSRTGRFYKSNIVLVTFDGPATRFCEILYTKLLEMGINTIPRMGLTHTMERNFYEISNNKQLVFQAPGTEELIRNLNGSIFLNAPESITHLSHIDPKKIGKALVARKYIRDIMNEREDQGHLGWTYCIYPTEELAKHAKLSIKEYTNQIITACFLNKKSPVSEWREIFDNALSIKKWLNSMKVKYFHVESENTDIKITPGEKRKWIGISGHNIPSFEIFLSPDWRGTVGKYYADQPSYRTGNYVKGVKFEFEKGSVVKTEALEGEDFVRNQLLIDNGANKLGEFSLTDIRFSKINKFMANTLFDENYGGKYGNCHIAVGASFSDTYDGNPEELTKERKKELGFNDSALHWDLVNTENKKVTAHLASGKKVTIYENGKFAY